MEVAVSILNEKDNYENAIKKINNTNANYLHLDIMDNTFTNTISFTYENAKKISQLNNKKLDIHIMSTELDNILDEYIKLKPDIISIHYESKDDINDYIKKIKDNNIKCSLAINPDTNISEIYEYLDKIDMVLVMSVYPGKGGQTFIMNTIDKIKSLNKLKNNHKILIEVDGGINNETIKYVRNYIDIAVSGSYITNSDNYQNKINQIINYND